MRCGERANGTPFKEAREETMIKRISLIALVEMGVVVAAAATPVRATTLDDVKKRGKLMCGVAPNIPGFAFTDAKGVRRGFDIDFCHALAAAVLGDASKIGLTSLGPRDAFAQLRAGAVDVLTHRFTRTYNRENGTGIAFTQALFYDGQGFMVRKKMGITSATKLNGASICIAQGTTTELNIADYFRTHGMQYKIVTFADLDEARRAYEAGRCDAWSNDRASLAARGLGLKDRSAHIILPETISKEPIGPVVRKGDEQWGDIVRWTMYSLIEAEELGVTSKNVEALRKTSKNPEVRRLLGAEGNLGSKNKLSADWAYNAIKAVGNYGEIFERHLGAHTRLGLSRGLNALWKNGGLLISPPFR
jgi:general L-amino acid transport system substrate-binding protein